MKAVLQEIARRRRAYAELALFEHFRDEVLSPRARLRFLPVVAHFVMTFADLNRFVLPFAAPRDALEEAVNVHAREDATHWPWYLEDLAALGLDEPRRLTSSLRELWSDETAAVRALGYALIGLIAGTGAVERLVIIEVIEGLGNATFSAVVPVAREIERREGIALSYSGNRHLAEESGHAMGSDHRLLAGVALDEAGRARAIELVRRACDAFEAFAVALHAHARSAALE